MHAQYLYRVHNKYFVGREKNVFGDDYKVRILENEFTTRLLSANHRLANQMLEQRIRNKKIKIIIHKRPLFVLAVFMLPFRTIFDI